MIAVTSAILNTLRGALVGGGGGRLVCTRAMASIHSAHHQQVHLVPLDVITRPLQPALDEDKVLSLMGAIERAERGAAEGGDAVPPVDVLWVVGREGGNYYYAFGGCHRLAAYSRLRRATVPAHLVRTTPADIAHYLGGSTPDFK